MTLFWVVFFLFFFFFDLAVNQKVGGSFWVLMLVLTMVVAALTLIERKVLSLIQRRVGPNFVGYRGRLQYIADALKLFLKGALIPDEANKFWFITIPAILGSVCYTL
jgi:NADH:ubiquinone oxidoreductase subunit H